MKMVSLKGFNTDIYGAGRALDRINITSNDSALILGAGGVARAVILALRKGRFRIFLLQTEILVKKLIPYLLYLIVVL